ncbi:6884_t:CDS:2, partial [Racocetra persica]
FYENQESHRKLRMDIWNGKETRDYEAVERSFSLYDIYTEEELKEKPLNDQRLREHEIKVKEIKERRLLRAYGYSSQEDLSNFRKLFGGETYLEVWARRYAAKPMPVSQSQTLV